MTPEVVWAVVVAFVLAAVVGPFVALLVSAAVTRVSGGVLAGRQADRDEAQS